MIKFFIIIKFSIIFESLNEIKKASAFYTLSKLKSLKKFYLFLHITISTDW